MLAVGFVLDSKNAEATVIGGGCVFGDVGDAVAVVLAKDEVWGGGVGEWYCWVY